MSLRQRLVSIYLGNRSIVALLLLLAVLEILFLARTIWPTALEIVVKRHLFELVVLLCLSQIILLLFKLLERAPRHVCRDEYESAALLRERVATDPRAALLLVFSAGLSSRFDLITTIHRATTRAFSTEVLAQSPEAALDRTDADRLRSNLAILARDHQGLPLEVRTVGVPATIRGFVLCDRDRSPLWGAVSWYRYRELAGGGVSVAGRRHPAIVIDGDASKEETWVLQFLVASFNETWQQSAAGVVYPIRPAA